MNWITHLVIWWIRLHLFLLFFQNLFYFKLSKSLSVTPHSTMCAVVLPQKRSLDSLDLELQAVVKYLMMMLGTEPWSQVFYRNKKDPSFKPLLLFLNKLQEWIFPVAITSSLTSSTALSNIQFFLYLFFPSFFHGLIQYLFISTHTINFHLLWPRNLIPPRQAKINRGSPLPPSLQPSNISTVTGLELGNLYIKEATIH